MPTRAAEVVIADASTATWDAALIPLNAAISGRITDPRETESRGSGSGPMVGLGRHQAAPTDADGYYTIDNLAAGDYQVSVGGPGTALDALSRCPPRRSPTPRSPSTSSWSRARPRSCRAPSSTRTTTASSTSASTSSTRRRGPSSSRPRRGRMRYSASRRSPTARTPCTSRTAPSVGRGSSDRPIWEAQRLARGRRDLHDRRSGRRSATRRHLPRGSAHRRGSASPSPMRRPATPSRPASTGYLTFDSVSYPFTDWTESGTLHLRDLQYGEYEFYLSRPGVRGPSCRVRHPRRDDVRAHHRDRARAARRRDRSRSRSPIRERRPIAGATATYTDAGGAHPVVDRDSDGVIALPDLAFGNYVVTVTAAGYVSATLPAITVDAATPDVTAP